MSTIIPQVKRSIHQNIILLNRDSETKKGVQDHVPRAFFKKSLLASRIPAVNPNRENDYLRYVMILNLEMLEVKGLGLRVANSVISARV